MARSIPTTEPYPLRAGDTWEWTKSLVDYPASAWTLTYTYFNATGAFSIVATADGDSHSISVAPATTAAHTAGRYEWIAQASDGTDQYQVGSGVLRVLPDLSAVDSYDSRSHARRMLDLINAILEGRATSGQIDIVRADVNGRNIEYDHSTLIKLRSQYAAAVRREDEAIRLARGENSGRFIGTRFTG